MSNSCLYVLFRRLSDSFGHLLHHATSIYPDKSADALQKSSSKIASKFIRNIFKQTLNDCDIMDERSKSFRFVTPYIIQERIKAQEDIKRNAVNMLLKRGMTIEQIAEIQSMTFEEVNAILQESAEK